jgi:type II secretory ATPase GspE/PulE/Tfp pilus assembly ATPase PilB-like protein
VRDRDVFLERALIDLGLLGREQLDAARRHGAEARLDLVDALVAKELISSRRLALVRADICEAPFADLSDFEPFYANTKALPRSVAERRCAFPLFIIDGVMTVAMDDPLDLEATDQIRQIARCEVDPVLAEREQIRALIAKAYSLSHSVAGDDADEAAIETEIEAKDASAPVVAAVNQMLADAVQQRASDIHLNPDEHELHLRYRVDGVLQSKQGPPLSMHAALVQRLKVMAHLDLTQTRRPQDGKFRFRQGDRNVDVRMSTIPTVCGENVVLRLLANAQTFEEFTQLGMPAETAEKLEDAIARPHGIVLVTGPTGSGKTTTLYTAISKLNEPTRNIMTIEDPVEIRLPYVRQIQVNSEIGMTFAGALRSILRQDPDVVLVGEIRDNETATIAMQAALTGHLVFSTLHTNDAVGAISRLRDYGLPPFVLNSSILGVMAQRLVRRVCDHCAGPAHVTDIVRARLRLDGDAAGYRQGRGCSRCGQTGYRGRVGLYEYLTFTPTIKRLVEEGDSVDRIREAAVGEGMRLMWQDGVAKAQLGQTTLDEVLKVASVVELEETADRAAASPADASGRSAA